MAQPNFEMFGSFEAQGRSDGPMACMICAPRPGGGFSGRKNGYQTNNISQQISHTRMIQMSPKGGGSTPKEQYTRIVQ